MTPPPVKTLRVWVDGSDPGTMIVQVDPPLEEGEVEIYPEPAISRTTTPRISEDRLERLRRRCAGGQP